MELRLEKKEDYAEVEKLNREAFWNIHAPGCDEHYLAHVLRDSPDFVHELDFVAVVDGKIAGNIMYTRSHIACDDGTECETLTFGPLAVLPEYQNRGIGKALIEHTKALAKDMGCKAIIIYGDPEYYKRCGFVGAQIYGIATPWNTYLDSLLALELVPGALKGCAGRALESEAYDVDSEAAARFDSHFPPKEKKEGLASQQRFKYLVSTGRPRE